MLIIVALLAALLGEALPTNAASSLRDAYPERSEAQSKDATTQSPPASEIASHPSTPQQEAAPLGTLAVTSTLKAPTASGPSLYLNGSNYVNVPHASLPAIGSSDLTLEAWIYPTNVTGFHAVLAKQYNVGFWFGVYNGKLRFYRGSTSFVEGATVIPV
ncbi:MAG: hypothetical protein HY870_07635, partial [Chloroflexi bacterium]|nr:hypothetical protein [Chloroflexota bacterium]